MRCVRTQVSQLATRRLRSRLWRSNDNHPGNNGTTEKSPLCNLESNVSLIDSSLKLRERFVLVERDVRFHHSNSFGDSIQCDIYYYTYSTLSLLSRDSEINDNQRASVKCNVKSALLRDERAGNIGLSLLSLKLPRLSNSDD